MRNSAMVFFVLAALTVGCSKSPSDVAPGSAVSQTTSSTAMPKSACDLKLIDAADAATLFNEPIVQTKNIPGDPQSCEFSTAGFSGVTISMRPGHGKSTLGTYTSGHMNQYDKSEPLPGVGDEAVRSLGLNRIIARKDDLLCEITGPGMARPAGDAMISKLGGLCNKIFAAQVH